MSFVNRNSLALTLDAISESFFYKRPLPKSIAGEAARWMASRQGMPGSYANMFAPTRKDFQNDLVLFTGEKVTTRVGKSHMLGR